MSEIEIWKPVVGYEGLYEVSNLGNVRSVKKIIKPHIIKGYLGVSLCKGGVKKKLFIHRLVAFAFPEICGEYFEGAVCNHKNENKLDNRAENLEWCTVAENDNWGNRNQKISKARRNDIRLSKPVGQYTLQWLLVAVYPSLKEAERQTKIHTSNIYNCCCGKYKQAGGYYWKYLN